MIFGKQTETETDVGRMPHALYSQKSELFNVKNHREASDFSF